MGQRIVTLNIDDEKELELVSQAINTSIRRRIMCLLRSSSYSIAELSRQLKMPISTVAFHVNILKHAGFVNVTVKRNSRGNAKIISRQIDSFSINFSSGPHERDRRIFSETIPIGSFVDASVEAGCGMASEREIIIADDMPGVFFSPRRSEAQMIWFSKGYLEYAVPNYMLKDKHVRAVTFSMELCSEAPNYRNDWPSEITFWVNGKEVVTYLSPGDLGGRRGRLNPDWWSDYSTQYGIMKTLKITEENTYLDENVASGYTVEKLGLAEGNCITLRIGIKPDAKHQGGLNLFGEKFGDFAQGLVYTVDYTE